MTVFFSMSFLLASGIYNTLNPSFSNSFSLFFDKKKTFLISPLNPNSPTAAIFGLFPRLYTQTRVI